ncbi:MAG: ABC transporter ATP-binding protein [Lachnospiraceae bacterium]|nr:ABC transporter ATP-binding protein [Lachnospiraceae bacterium]
MANLLEVKNLTKKYYAGTVENKAVDSVNLKVEEGEFVIIMGASGSGKTSLLHLVAGIDDFDEGMIMYAPSSNKAVDFGHMNETAKAMFRSTNIGIVFQQQCLIPDLTVYENIMLPIMLSGKRKERAGKKETIINLCGQFGLKEHIKKYPSQLSGGQQQRAAILRSVINRPPLLLCDEPTGSLNSAQSNIVMELLNRLNRIGQTIILVTHDVKVAVRGSRVIYIEDGRVAGELKFTDEHRSMNQREEELMNFLQQRGW